MPYASKAIVQHVFDADHLDVYVEFRSPMQLYIRPLGGTPYYPLTPPLSKWLLECDDVLLAVVASDWLDEHTLLLTSSTIAPAPGKVTLKYDGPDSGLQTAWGKQWEPFGPIVSLTGWPTTFEAGMIMLWSGSIDSIPAGWHLCDGTEGAPDLRDRFIVGAGSAYAPAATGGKLTHTHTTTQTSHNHIVNTGGGVQAGSGAFNVTSSTHGDITVADSNHLPLYYALCYIMKL